MALPLCREPLPNNWLRLQAACYSRLIICKIIINLFTDPGSSQLNDYTETLRYFTIVCRPGNTRGHMRACLKRSNIVGGQYTVTWSRHRSYTQDCSEHQDGGTNISHKSLQLNDTTPHRQLYRLPPPVSLFLFSNLTFINSIVIPSPHTHFLVIFVWLRRGMVNCPV